MEWYHSTLQFRLTFLQFQVLWGYVQSTYYVHCLHVVRTLYSDNTHIVRTLFLPYSCLWWWFPKSSLSCTYICILYCRSKLLCRVLVYWKKDKSQCCYYYCLIIFISIIIILIIPIIISHEKIKYGTILWKLSEVYGSTRTT